MEITPTMICRCQLVENKIQFCSLHESAKQLLAACEFVRKFLSNLKCHDHQNLIRNLVLPYVDNVLGEARKSEPAN
jgi:hypothetical protein